MDISKQQFMQFRDYPQLITAFAEIKKACALANAGIGVLTDTEASAISKACDEIIKDPEQGTEFTETTLRVDGLIFNQAVNISLARRTGISAAKINAGQGFEDVFNTAQNLVTYRAIEKSFKGLQNLMQTLRNKAVAFQNEMHVGRSHMQEALPVSWGAVFGAMYLRLRRAYEELQTVQKLFLNVNLGMTPIDPLMLASPGFAAAAVNHLRIVSGLLLRASALSGDSVLGAAYVDALEGDERFLRLSSVLRLIALNYARLGNDFYLYSSGPRCGIAELSLPAIAPGSTIMPGKINPSMPELMFQIMHQTVGTDQLAAFAFAEEDIDIGSSNGWVFFQMLEILEIIGRGADKFVEKCAAGIGVKHEESLRHLENAASLISLVEAVYGREIAVQVKNTVSEKEVSIPQALSEVAEVSDEEVRALFSFERFANPQELVRFLSAFKKQYRRS